MSLPCSENTLQFFKSKGHEYVYYLLNYQGAKLSNCLGFNYKCYCNRDETKQVVEKVTEVIKQEFPNFNHDIVLALSNLDDLAKSIIND